MNTKGTKFLAVLAVLAMAFAAFAVIAPADESDAAVAHGAKYTEAQGPLDFTATLNPGDDKDYTNATALKSNIAIAFDATSLTYTVTGTLYKQNLSDHNTGFYKLYPSNTEYLYGLGAMITIPAAGDLDLTGGDIDGHAHYGDAATDDLLFYIKSTATRYATFTPDADPEHPVTYTIDLSGVTLSETKVADAPAGYVAVAGANALAGGATSGNDMNGGTWSYAAGVLTLTNYNGNEVFESATLTQVTLSGDNRIEATAAYAISSTAGAPLTIKPVEGQGTLEIVLKGAGEIVAIHHNDTLNVQATDLSISVPESGADSCGIAANTLNLYEATLEIAMDATTVNTGIAATTVDIKSCASVEITAYKGINGNTVSVAASVVDITSAIGGITANLSLSAMKSAVVSAEASISLPEYYEPVYGIKTAAISVESESTISADKMQALNGTNNATISVDGDFVLVDDGVAETVFVNKATVTVGGDFIVMGQFDNQGTATVAGKTILQKINDAFYTTDISAIEFAKVGTPAATSYYVKVITLTGYETINATTAYVEGTFTIAKVEDDSEKAVSFDGVATVDSNGVVSDIAITISGNHPTAGAYVANVPITYVTVENHPEESGYVIAAAGEVVPNAEDAKVILVDSKKLNVEKVRIVGLTATTEFGVSAGTYTATGGIFAYKGQAALVSGEGSISGALTVGTDAAVTTTGGTLAGNVTTKSAFELGGVLNGDISSSQNVTIDAAATMTGKIAVTAAATITVNGTLTGNIEIADKLVNVDVAGKMVGDIVLSGKYKSQGATTADTDYVATITLDTNKGGNTRFISTAANENTPGFFSVSANFGLPANDKVSSVTLANGTLKLTANLTIPVTVDLTIASGATLEVASVATIIINGAIKAEDGSIVNIYDADKKVYSYGKLTNELTFYVAPYTYYCSFTYALANAPEGTVLDVTKDVTVDAKATVKKNVIVNVGENKTITFNANKVLAMGDGAYFNLADGAKIVFTARDDAKYVDSGVIKYGDNQIEIKSAYFKTANATITANKATNVVPANLGFVGTVAAGEVVFSAGALAGTVTFETLGAGTPESPYTSGIATIADGAVYSGTYVKDAQAKAKFVIDGIWKVNASRAIDMSLSGTGNIELADAVALTINNGYAAAAANRVAQTLNVTYGDNAVKMDKLIVGDANATYGGLNMVITAVKATSTAAAYMKIESATPATGFALFSGDVEVAGEVSLGKTFLDADAKIVVPTGATLTLIKDTVTSAVGLLSVSGTFNFNLADDETKTYGVLDSQISYKDGSATVYAALATAITKGGVTDFTVSSNIEMEGGTAAEPKDLGNVTLAVAEGKKLTLTGYVILGTAATTVGAAPGVTGNIVLADGAVLIVYDNATVNADKVFANAAMTVKASMSQYVISFNDAVYATIFANHTGGDVEFDDVQDALSPSFDGYRFTGYEPYVAGATKIGDSDVAILLEAGKVSITLAAVEGVTYYIDGAACKQTGAPVQVFVGSVVSAQANAGYTGTVKVNGQDYITVDPTTKTITASGASPITPEPEPEQGGLGLTEILLIVLVILIAIMVVVLLIKLNRS